MTAAERIGARAVARMVARIAEATGGQVTPRGVEIARPGEAIRRWPAGAVR